MSAGGVSAQQLAEIAARWATVRAPRGPVAISAAADVAALVEAVRHAQRELEMAYGCLDMVREALEYCGLPMQGCAPMFYDDAIRQLAGILGRAAGLERWVDVQRHVAEYEPGGGGRAGDP